MQKPIEEVVTAESTISSAYKESYERAFPNLFQVFLIQDVKSFSVSNLFFLLEALHANSNHFNVLKRLLEA
jgi:hypothetical protein